MPLSTSSAPAPEVFTSVSFPSAPPTVLCSVFGSCVPMVFLTFWTFGFSDFGSGATWSAAGCRKGSAFEYGRFTLGKVMLSCSRSAVHIAGTNDEVLQAAFVTAIYCDQGFSTYSGYAGEQLSNRFSAFKAASLRALLCSSAGCPSVVAHWHPRKRGWPLPRLARTRRMARFRRLEQDYITVFLFKRKSWNL